MKLTVDSWCAWATGGRQSTVCTHYCLGKQSQTYAETPDVSRVPPMQRRRLGSLARVVFHVLDKCAEAGADEPAIFSSYMGEIQRTFGILKNMATKEPISPGAFSLSVHNAIAGQWSLIRGIEAPMLALSSPSNSPVPALLEAAGILKEGYYSSVNVVFYDELLPEFFLPFLDGPPAPIALAMRLIRESEMASRSAVRFTLRQCGTGTNDRSVKNPAGMFDLLSGKETRITVDEPQCSWELKVTA